MIAWLRSRFRPEPTLESEMNRWIAEGLALLENYANRGCVR